MKSKRSAGSIRDYKDGPKNNWRRWLWNRVLGRTNGREWRELILYLAGLQDLDRLVVGDRMPSDNLIALNDSKPTVTVVRSAGNYAIEADALEALRAWPEHQKVCAVVLDLCSGLWEVDDLTKLSALMMTHPALIGAVIALNFQRGRELAGNKMIRVGDQLNWDAIHRDFGANIGPKHRGFMFAATHSTMASVLACGGPQEGERALRCLNPAFFSYKSSSGNLIFDSVVMDAFSKHWNCDDPEVVEHNWKLVCGVSDKKPSVVRRIAATLATRTRRATA